MAKSDLVSCFFKEQDDTWEKPARLLTRAELKEKKALLGKYENNGRTFRLFECRPIELRVYRDDSPDQSSAIESDTSISFAEMLANVGIVDDGVRNPRGVILLAQEKIRWYGKIFDQQAVLARGSWLGTNYLQVATIV